MKIAINLLIPIFVYFFIGYFLCELLLFIINLVVYKNLLSQSNDKIIDTIKTNTQEIEKTVKCLTEDIINSGFMHLVYFKQHMNTYQSFIKKGNKNPFITDCIINSTDTKLENLDWEKTLDEYYSKLLNQNKTKEAEEEDKSGEKEKEGGKTTKEEGKRRQLKIEEKPKGKHKAKFKKKTKRKLDDKDSSGNNNTSDEIINELMNYELLNKVSMYTSTNTSSLNYTSISETICFALIFLKSAIIRNVIDGNHKEILNFTLLSNDTIFTYPPRYLTDESIKALPFFNTSKSKCMRDKYDFDCFSMMNLFLYRYHYIYRDQYEANFKFTPYNSLIISTPYILKERTFVYNNFCTFINNIPTYDMNIDGSYLYNTKNSGIYSNYLCLTYNITGLITSVIHNDTDFVYNACYYSNGDIYLIFASNPELFSLIFGADTKLFNDTAYGKYQLTGSNTQLHLFHSIYYDLEKNYKLTPEDKGNLVKEYENNIKSTRVVAKDLYTNPRQIESLSNKVNQSFLYYTFDDKGQKVPDNGRLDSADFVYYFSTIMTNSSKIQEGLNLIDEGKGAFFCFSVSTVKISDPLKTSDIYEVFIFSCIRDGTFFLSLALLILVCIYLFSFFFFISTLNPLKRFKKNIKDLIKKVNSKNFNEDSENKEAKIEKKAVKNEQAITYNKTDPKYYLSKILNFNIKFGGDFTNHEMKEIEDVVVFLQKILLLNNKSTPNKTKAEFYHSISSEIKNHDIELFKCLLIVAKLYLKDNFFYKAKNELEILLKKIQLRIEKESDENKNNKNLTGHLSSYYGTYINEYTNLYFIFDKTILELQLALESANYLLGLCYYSIFKEIKRQNKNILKNEKNKNENNKDEKDKLIIDSSLDSKMDYYLENAIIHFKAAYKINNHLQINLIKNIIILVYISKCYMEFSNKSYLESNTTLKKAFVALTKLNDLIQNLTVDSLKRKFSNMNDLVLETNFKCYVDSRVMLMINDTLIQLILYQTGKMSLKLHKYKASFFCLSKLLQSGYFKNEYIEMHSVKWLFRISKKVYENGQKTISSGIGKNYNLQNTNYFKKPSKSICDEYYSNSTIRQEEESVPKSAIEHMKTHLREVLKLFKNNPYKRKEKKLIKEILDNMEKIAYKNRSIFLRKNDSNYKPSMKMSTVNFGNNCNIINFVSSINNNNSNMNCFKDKDGEKRMLNSPEKREQSIKKTKPSRASLHYNRASSCIGQEINVEDFNGSEDQVIEKKKYTSIIKEFLNRDLLISEILNSPISISNMGCIYFRLKKMYERMLYQNAPKKLVIFVAGESFAQNFNSLRAFDLLMRDCLNKFLSDDDKIGLVFYSMVDDSHNKIIELKNKSECEDIFNEITLNGKISESYFKSKTRFFTNAFDKAIELFNKFEGENCQESSDNNYDRYIFCFGRLSDLRYKNPEYSRAQKNIFNYKNISLYFFAFEKPIKDEIILKHYRTYFHKFIEGILIFVENFRLIKFAFRNISSTKIEGIHLNTDISFVGNIL